MAQTLMIGDVARRSGLTERTLRHYESMGLIKPQRTEARQRVYAHQDLVRLTEIQLLKKAGFSLAEIRTLLGQKSLDIRPLVLAQKELLEAEAKRVASAIQAMDSALGALDAGQPVDLSTLCQLIRIGEQTVSEEKWQKVWDKYYTEDEQERWRRAKEAVPDDKRKACEASWLTLVARTEALLGTDPAAPEAQAILQEWNASTQMIYDIDPSLTRSAARMYDDMDNWPKDGAQAPFSAEVWQFVKAAEAAAKASKG